MLATIHNLFESAQHSFHSCSVAINMTTAMKVTEYSNISLDKDWCTVAFSCLWPCSNFFYTKILCLAFHTLYACVFIVYPVIDSRGQRESNKGQLVEGAISTCTSLYLVSSVAKSEKCFGVVLITHHQVPFLDEALWLRTADGPDKGHHWLPAFIAPEKAAPWECCVPVLFLTQALMPPTYTHVTSVSSVELHRSPKLSSNNSLLGFLSPMMSLHYTTLHWRTVSRTEAGWKSASHSEAWGNDQTAVFDALGMRCLFFNDKLTFSHHISHITDKKKDSYGYMKE